VLDNGLTSISNVLNTNDQEKKRVEIKNNFNH